MTFKLLDISLKKYVWLILMCLVTSHAGNNGRVWSV